MDVKFTKRNGDIFTLKRIGIMATDFIVSAPEIDTETELVEGSHGEKVTDRRYRRRSIVIPFYALMDSMEFSSKRDEVYSLLVDTSSLYVEELRGGKNGYEFIDISDKPEYTHNHNFNVTGKRYTVHLIGIDNFSDDNGFVEGQILLETIETPFAESVNIIKRRHTDDEFTFKNSGTEVIDMRNQMETEIIFKGASDNLKIENLTTGDVWQYNGNTSDNDEIKLKGIRSLKNDESIFGETNRRLISFATGNNKFKISGADDFELFISTRFYFK